MEEGINMGRRCPWSKDSLKKLYNTVDSYCKLATLHALNREGQQVAMETMAAYSIFKYPIVYVFIHYHFGVFEDLGMKDGEISSYLMYLQIVRNFTQGMIDEMSEHSFFDFDEKNEIAPRLVEICKEVILIEDNF